MYPLVLPETSTFARSGRLRNSLLLIHYFLPLVVGWSLTLVMRQATRASLSPCGLALLLAGIGAAYCFDRLIDTAHAPIASPLWLHRMLRWGFAISACILLILILAGEIQPGLLVSCGLLTIVGFLYSYLKRIPLAKTIGVALAWSWACATLPFANAHAARWEWLTNEASLPLVLLISANCILCDLKDAAQDRCDRIPSLPVVLGARTASLVATGLALLSAVAAAIRHCPGVAIPGVLLAAAAQFPALLACEPIGPIVADSILIISGVLISTGAV